MAKKLLMLAVFITMALFAVAQTTYTWDFETDPMGNGSYLPPGYDYDSANVIPGEYGAGYYTSATHAEGFLGREGWIRSRAFYFSEGSNADISGWFWNSTNGTVSLRLAYSSSPNGPWTNFYTSGNMNTHGIWTEVTANFDLTTLGLPAGEYYFHFTLVNNGNNTRGYLDDISLVYYGDPPLPVELSSFSAAISASNYVNLLWVTQTETGVLGYYIYRNTADDFATAEQISSLIPATNTSQQQSYIYTDNEIVQDGTYYYWLQSADFDGGSDLFGSVNIEVQQSTTGEGIIPGPQLRTGVNKVFPNPFTSSTTIHYGVAKNGSDVQISVHNVRGELVRELVNGHFNSNPNYTVGWDGKDYSGRDCSNGLYFIVLKSGGESSVRKAILVK